MLYQQELNGRLLPLPPSMSESDEFDFDLWAENAGFSTDAIEKFKKANLLTPRAIGGLLTSEFAELKLSIGDRSILRGEWEILSVQEAFRKHRATADMDVVVAGTESTVLQSSGQTGDSSGGIGDSSGGGPVRATSSGRIGDLQQESGGDFPGAAGGAIQSQATKESQDKVTLQTLGKDTELQQLVDSVCSPLLKDYLTVQDCASAGNPGSGIVSSSFPYLAIPDYVKGLPEVDEEVLQTASSGAQVVLKGSKRKPLPKDVSIPQ